MPNTKVMVGRFGSDPVEVVVTGPATLAKVMEKAGIELSDEEKLWVNGKQATRSTKVKTNDIVAIVSPKEAGR
jgi:hypothetical protein